MILSCKHCNTLLSNQFIDSSFSFDDKLNIQYVRTYKCVDCNQITKVETIYPRYELEKTKIL